MSFAVAAFYRFLPLDDLDRLKSSLSAFCRERGMRGTILLASEGVNGTVAGAEAPMAEFVEELGNRFGIARGEIRFSQAADWPFARMKVRIRPEIITLRDEEADPNRRTGHHVSPQEWNAVISDPETLLLDTRNRYETRVGGFEGAVDPGIDQFTDFKDYVERELDPAKHRKVAMFCTGGIRCEKASAWMLSKGFEEVYQLKGGILSYLETVPAEDSRWQGACYVFDGRVALGQGLSSTDWTACFACGAPLSPEDRASPEFEDGVSCPHCADQSDAARAEALRERHRRMTKREG
ncbi:oxygen-dependent tRNA uridine(34) hydroxylase TrhO [Jiella marina]|uniref:oxygen-dependent tRNA uridine(34) hydroxylase TrhO n=1 Tax=Jiella sp. LLJ827 TaxID=2917712 RepID=UPI0021012EF0|nr:rhodanese-related sulfurtransferase [Jiella sp. LLJ827]MCQ0987946.1 rhodanese-related sulfurtransferase [Jiella sp. LLJ827]